MAGVVDVRTNDVTNPASGGRNVNAPVINYGVSNKTLMVFAVCAFLAAAIYFKNRRG